MIISEWTAEERKQLSDSKDIKATAQQMIKELTEKLMAAEKDAKQDVKEINYTFTESDTSALDLIEIERDKIKDIPSADELKMMKFLFTVINKEFDQKETWKSILEVCKAFSFKLKNLVLENIPKQVTKEHFKRICNEFKEVKYMFEGEATKFDGYEYIGFIKIFLQDLIGFYGLGKQANVNAYFVILKARLLCDELFAKKQLLELVANA